MSLTTPLSVQKLQTVLHDKAKESPDRRFHALYDKMYRSDVLAFAYECCKANGGAAGVDGQTFERIEEYGVERWLDELAKELKDRTYQPHPVRRVMTGWANYFCLGPVSKAYRAVEQHARKRLRRWLRAKHKVSGPATGQFPDEALHDEVGLVRLSTRTRSFPWATS